MNRVTTALSKQAIERFHTRGYLTLDALIPEEEVEQLRQIYDRLFSEKTGWDKGDQFDLAGTDEGEAALPQLLGPSRYAPELRETHYVHNARFIARQLLGPEMIEKHGEHMIFKPAERGAATPWHQDQAYHDPTMRQQGVNFWLPLDDATVESGCLHFVPGSHKLDVLPHHPINNDPRIHGLEVDQPERYEGEAVACPLPAGGATLHASYMLHSAKANSSCRPRRAYILTFRLPAQKRDIPIDNYWKRAQQTARAARAERSSAR